MRFFFVLFLFCQFASARAAQPDVESIVRKLGEQGADPVLSAERNAVAYTRESRVDYLDDADRVKKRAVRKYLVSPVNGEPVTTLLSVNGKPANEDDDQRRSRARETGDRTRSLSLSHELLSRFDFTFAGEEMLAGRKAWMLRFLPKAGVEAEGFFERLVGAMSGILWVDAEENQLAKAEIFLARKVSFFGGIAGAIERMDLTFVQKRFEPDLWVGESAFIDFAGRKLFSAVRFRCYETYSEFRKVQAQQQSSQQTVVSGQ